MSALNLLTIYGFLIFSVILMGASAYFFIDDESLFCSICAIGSVFSFFLFVSSFSAFTSSCENNLIETISEIETIIEDDSKEEIFDVDVKYDSGTYVITIKE